MPATPERSLLVERWLKYAEDDQASAARLMADPPLLAGVVFHSQQAAEKALKAHLHALTVASVPRTHRLRDLSELGVRAGGSAPPDDAVNFLDTYSVSIRYPEADLPLAEVGQQAIQYAEQIMSFVRRQLGNDNG